MPNAVETSRVVMFRELYNMNWRLIIVSTFIGKPMIEEELLNVFDPGKEFILPFRVFMMKG